MKNNSQLMTDEQWKEQLSDEQYRVLRQKSTEMPFTGKLLSNKEKGTYSCAGCHAVLFSHDTKFNSGSGWPSFWDVVDQAAVKLVDDTSHFMTRTEVACAACGGHLGHVFDDGPRDKTGLRYCINSAALSFESNAPNSRHQHDEM